MFAGGWNLGVNMMAAFALVIFATYSWINVFFVQPLGRSESLWHSEDGRVPPTLGSKRLTVFGLVAIDVLLMVPLIMPIHGLIPGILGYWNCMVRGNRFDFVSAAKTVDTAPSRDGSSPQIGRLRAGSSPISPSAPITFGKISDADAIRLRQTSKVAI
jgi:hypothetical protein